jgi:hypothetical protein
MVMDTPLSCLLYPELPFAGALSLARFCSPRDTGAVLRFELTRSSVARGFDRGISAAAMLEILTRLSGNRVDGNLGWTLQDWESRYAAVSLHQGLVLTLAEDRRYLAGTEPLAALIRLSLAPGVYLLSVSDSAPALEALKKAGVDMVARREWGLSPEESPGDGSLEGLASPFPPLGRPEEPLVEPPLPGTRPSPKIPPKGPLREGPEGLKERFHAALDRLSIPKQERDELAARIERRLVLRESQMEGAVIRYEKLEARGLDYVGKAAIAKQAIAAKSPVDVLWTRAGGGSGQILGVPTALVKQEGESVLVLNPLPAGEELRLPLGKISLIRRIKQSIFET